MPAGALDPLLGATASNLSAHIGHDSEEASASGSHIGSLVALSLEDTQLSGAPEIVRGLMPPSAACRLAGGERTLVSLYLIAPTGNGGSKARICGSAAPGVPSCLDRGASAPGA
eukprot:scaffold325863_cov59-Tisochrysis_lutea.AAC.1